MERGRTIRGEELRDFLKSINRLGYPPRPPPVPLAGRDWPQEPLEDPFIEPDSSQFIDDTSQVPPAQIGTPSDAIVPDCRQTVHGICHLGSLALRDAWLS